MTPNDGWWLKWRVARRWQDDSSSSRSAPISPPPLPPRDPDPRGEETEEDSTIRPSRSEVTVEVCEEEDASLMENTTTDLPPFIDLQSLLTSTELPPGFSLMVITSSHVKAPHRVTRWPRRCTPLAFYLWSTSWRVMWHRYGMLMMHLLAEELLTCENGGTGYSQLDHCLVITPTLARHG